MSKNNYYKSSDLAFIAAAQIFGYQIQSIEKTNSTKVFFLIQQDKELDNLIQAFRSRSLRVCPLTYFESLRATKARIYQ